jgi:hypothetical protein
MKKRLLLNGVNMYRARIPINNGSQDTIDIDSDPALAALAGLNQAHFWT